MLKALESYVDDNGVGVDDIELIVTETFPRDMFANGSETVARVSEAISELHQAHLVWRYEGPNDHLLFISFWEEVQRIDKPGKGRYPRPDGTFNYRDSIIRDTLASPPETLAPGTGEQGNRGTEEQGSRGGADAPAPPSTCGKHSHWDHDDPCRACARDRQAYEAEKKQLEADARRAARRQPQFCPHGLPRHEACERCGDSWPGK